MINTTGTRIRWLVGTLLAVLVISGCGVMSRQVDPRIEETGGNIERGGELARTNGCIMCHSVDGMGGVENGYGPSLDGFAGNRLIAGGVDNTPDALIRFLMDPQAVVPGTGMPSVGLTEQEARDIAAWLYSLED